MGRLDNAASEKYPVAMNTITFRTDSEGPTFAKADKSYYKEPPKTPPQWDAKETPSLYEMSYRVVNGPRVEPRSTAALLICLFESIV